MIYKSGAGEYDVNNVHVSAAVQVRRSMFSTSS